MNAPAQGHEPEPDPEEPIQRWEVAVCVVCARTIWRRVRRTPGPWRHFMDEQP